MAHDPRSRRVDVHVAEAIALALLEDVKDPRLELVTVTGVEVSRDRRYAKVFVTAHGGAERYAEVLEALEGASGRLKTGIKNRVRMRFIPELSFSIDPSVDEGMRITEVIRESKRQEGEE